MMFKCRSISERCRCRIDHSSVLCVAAAVFLLQVVRFMIRSAAVCNITFSTAQPGKIKLIQSRLRLLSEHFPLSLFFYRD